MSSKTPEQLRDVRLGDGACCGNCRHAYPLKLTLKDTALDCRGGPPVPSNVALMDNGGNIVGQRLSAHYVPRLVDPNYFCGAWQRDIQALI